MAGRGRSKILRGARAAALEKLRNWSDLNRKLMAMSEDEVAELLEVERTHGKGRLTFLLRLQARLNRLRRERERAALAKGARR